MSEYNLISLLRGCDHALKHFHERWTVLQRHTLVFRRSSEIKEHYNFLQQAHGYVSKLLKNPRPGTEINEFHCQQVNKVAWSTMLDVTAQALVRETDMLAKLVQSLGCLRDELLGEMTTEDILILAREASDDERAALLDLCRRKRRAVELYGATCTDSYNLENVKDKTDIKKELIKADFDRNPHLNKFEEVTHNQVSLFADFNLDNAWRLHCNNLAGLLRGSQHATARLALWDEKIAALEILNLQSKQGGQETYEIQDTVGDEDTAMIDAGVHQQDVEQDADEHRHTEAVSMHPEPHQLNKPNHFDIYTPDETLESPTSNKFTPTTADAGQDLVVQERPQPNTVDDIIADHNEITEEPSPMSSNVNLKRDSSTWPLLGQDSVFDGDHIPKPAVEMPQPTSIVRNPITPRAPSQENTPAKEDSLNSISKRTYDYDFNKENVTPIAAFPDKLPAKDSSKKAFAGLDKYAQNLFGKSPSTTPQEKAAQ